MPTFDATKPAANSPISSSELRDQRNALNDSLTAVSSAADTANSEIHYLNNNISALTPLATTYTGPVTAANLNELRDAINAIISQLQA